MPRATEDRETEQTQSSVEPSLIVTNEGDAIKVTFLDLGSITVGSHSFVRVAPETVEIIKKWGTDIDKIAKFADEIMESVERVWSNPPMTMTESATARTRMSEHKKKLIEFFNKRPEPAPRHLILGMTGIPAGSLSTLLREPEFYPVEHGMWILRSLLPFGGKNPDELAKELDAHLKKKGGGQKPE